jgi:hypothetical protein
MLRVRLCFTVLLCQCLAKFEGRATIWTETVWSLEFGVLEHQEHKENTKGTKNHGEHDVVDFVFTL